MSVGSVVSVALCCDGLLASILLGWVWLGVFDLMVVLSAAGVLLAVSK